MRGKMKLAGVVILATALSGCKVASPYKAPLAPTATAYGAENEATSTDEKRVEFSADVDDKWWKNFASEKLNALVERALRNSPTIEAAQARVRAAEAEGQAVRGETILPQATLQAGSKQEKNDLHAMGMPATIQNPNAFTLTSLSVAIEYNFDLNHAGHYSRAIARDAVAWQREKLDAARLTLAGNVVAEVFALVNAEERQSKYAAELANEEQRFAILQNEIAAGARAEESSESSRRRVDTLRETIENAKLDATMRRRKIAVLTGAEPGSALEIPDRLSDFSGPKKISVVVPSSLVRNRPEIRAAEMAMKEAGDKVGLATANLYPTVTLTGNASTERRTIADLANGLNLWSIGGSASAPILNRKALHAQKAEAIAQYNEALANYRETVLEGLLETSQALAEVHAAAVKEGLAKDRYASAKKSTNVAERRYDAGAVSHLALIDATAAMLEEERNLAEIEVNKIQASATLMAATAARID